MNIILIQKGYKVLNYEGVHTISIEDGDFLTILCETLQSLDAKCGRCGGCGVHCFEWCDICGGTGRIRSAFSWASKSFDKIDKSIPIDEFRIEVK